MSDVPMFDLETVSHADIEGDYRYSLTRRWGPGPTVVWIMLNPSTADATQNDPTIRRCIGFSRREGAGGLRVVNLFAFRATEPAHCLNAVDPYGPRNDDAILDAVTDDGTIDGQVLRIIAAWGERGSFRNRDQQVLELLRKAGVETVHCLGRTTSKLKAPRHPLYVRADHPLEAFWTHARQSELDVGEQLAEVHQLGARS